MILSYTKIDNTVKITYYLRKEIIPKNYICESSYRALNTHKKHILNQELYS